MPEQVFCIGSNLEPAANISRTLDALRDRFGPLRCSSAYRSAAVGFTGPDFLNLCALAESGEAPPDIVVWLKRLELRLGRNPSQPRYSSRPIDIDLFIPDAPDGAHGKLTVSHQEIRENAFLLRPLAELLPNLKLEPGGSDLATLWKIHDNSAGAITRVELTWSDQGPRAPTGMTSTPSGRR